MASKRLRSDNDILLIGLIDYQITGAKLPSIKQVLQVLFYNLRIVGLNLRDSTTSVVFEVATFWRKARIPTQRKRNSITKLENLYNEWRSITKNYGRKTETQKKKETEFQEKLDDIFDIAHGDVLELIKIQEDKEFLLKQREKGRPGCMVGTDKILSQKEKRRAEQNEEEIHRKRKENIRKELYEQQTQSGVIDDINIVEVVAAPSEAYVKANESIKTPSGILRGSTDFITPRLLSTLDKWKISDGAAVHILSATADALGHRIEDLILNRSSIHRMRQKHRAISAQNIAENFDIPSSFVLHWDGTMLPEISGREKVDRLPIIISSQGIDKLLGIPKLKSSTGKEISEAVFNSIKEYKILDQVQIICFDTTAHNTGVEKGAAALLEGKLGRDLLYFPCRHHIYELLIRKVFEMRVATTAAPEVLIFNRFSKHLNNIEKNNYKSCLEDEHIVKMLTAEEREVILNYCLHNLKQTHSRRDYKELLQLVITFLGGTVPNFNTFRIPGATSHARWMSKAIYSLKMYLFRDQFNMTKKELNGIRSVCIFIVRIYVKAWFGCTKPNEAPNQDLNLIKNINAYPERDIALALLQKVSNHMWYLSEEAVGLSFFDPNVSVAIKKKMVKAINVEANTKKCKRVVNNSSSILQTYSQKDLRDFVNSNTILFFDRLEISKEFLKVDPSDWNARFDYAQGTQICQNLSVVNDAAERGAKFITDYNNKLTHNEEEKQFLFQVIKEYNMNYPTFKKSSLLN